MKKVIQCQFYILFSNLIFLRIFFGEELKENLKVQEELQGNFWTNLYDSRHSKDKSEAPISLNEEQLVNFKEPYSLQMEVIKPYQLRIYLKPTQLQKEQLFLLIFLDENYDLTNLKQKGTSQEMDRSITVALEQTGEGKFTNMFYKIGIAEDKYYNPFLGEFPIKDIFGNSLMTYPSFFKKLLIRFSGDGVVSYPNIKKDQSTFLNHNKKGEFVFDIYLDPNFNVHRWKFEFGIINIKLFSGNLEHISVVDTIDVSKTSHGLVSQDKIFFQKNLI